MAVSLIKHTSGPPESPCNEFNRPPYAQDFISNASQS